MVNKKAKAILVQGMTPIVCCGETLEEREAGAARRPRSRVRSGGPWRGHPEHVASLVIA